MDAASNGKSEWKKKRSNKGSSTNVHALGDDWSEKKVACSTCRTGMVQVCMCSHTHNKKNPRLLPTRQKGRIAGKKKKHTHTSKEEKKKKKKGKKKRSAWSIALWGCNRTENEQKEPRPDARSVLRASGEVAPHIVCKQVSTCLNQQARGPQRSSSSFAAARDH